MKQERKTHKSFGRQGFTLLDILVAISVISLLIAILAPTLSRVQETSRRVICASNLRQHGLAIQLYTDNHNGILPPSAFIAFNDQDTSRMMTLRLPTTERRRLGRDGWDGLGVLFRADYVNTPGLFYCPSHKGNHPFSLYESRWAGKGGEIVGNYHYRGQDGNGIRNIFQISGSIALVSDGMRTQDDFNHEQGLNVLRAGLHVGWVDDSQSRLLMMRPDSETQAGGTDDSIADAWRWLDNRLP
ncbi:MAG: type II secretion system protein [Phycisphaeraceae bacterium]|nr:type II secretion system protein [Phycisphaeraceae bacterium]MCW5763109.1 type II secretion system protein [Phycisphaeraceae bacterium]